MPLYEYQCDACGHRFEKIQKFSDPPIEKCPVCDRSVRKLLSSPAIQFKGSGWYITDYARKDSSAAGKSEKSQGTQGEGKAESKSDSKAESKSETKAESKAEPKTGESSKP